LAPKKIPHLRNFATLGVETPRKLCFVLGGVEPSFQKFLGGQTGPRKNTSTRGGGTTTWPQNWGGFCCPTGDHNLKKGSYQNPQWFTSGVGFVAFFFFFGLKNWPGQAGTRGGPAPNFFGPKPTVPKGVFFFGVLGSPRTRVQNAGPCPPAPQKPPGWCVVNTKSLPPHKRKGSGAKRGLRIIATPQTGPPLGPNSPWGKTSATPKWRLRPNTPLPPRLFLFCCPH